jgi:hypothetical protein
VGLNIKKGLSCGRESFFLSVIGSVITYFDDPLSLELNVLYDCVLSFKSVCCLKSFGNYAFFWNVDNVNHVGYFKMILAI